MGAPWVGWSLFFSLYNGGSLFGRAQESYSLGVKINIENLAKNPSDINPGNVNSRF